MKRTKLGVTIHFSRSLVGQGKQPKYRFSATDMPGNHGGQSEDSYRQRAIEDTTPIGKPREGDITASGEGSGARCRHEILTIVNGR